MKKSGLLFVLFPILFSCNQSTDYINISGFTQGTTYSITYQCKKNKNYQAEIENLLCEFDTSLSTYNKLSLITSVNNNTENRTDEYLKTVFVRAMEISEYTDGAFDITVGPLVNAWGFGFTDRENIDQHKIDSILQFIGYKKIWLENDRIIKSDPRVKMDMNAIAQGYSVDIVALFIEKNNIQNYLVEIGGEVRTLGLNPKGETWKIGIDKPIDNNNIPGENLQAIIHLNNKSLATSGNYRRFYEKDGIKYSHTINPKTGYPVNHSLLSATVIANDCMTADAFATAFMVLGLEKSINLVQQHPELEAYFVYSDEAGNYSVKSTKGINEILEEVEQ
ncbi:MAG: FAD:protein FMN transferase [Bacteroidales bacterium]|jgi:thiamine biosynthesis lipoprotein|nr:FAD:protein FMN transferase [Bacteroidales bacterium]